LKILFLTKRQYTGKDLIDDRFGRYWHLSLELSRAGHKVQIVCLSYQYRSDGWIYEPEQGVGPRCYSINAGTVRALGLIRYTRRVLSLGREFGPDVVLAGSDTLYGIVGQWCARKLDVPLVFDLYDNYAAFAAYRIPLVASLYHRVLSRAAAITCASEPLAEYIRSEFRPNLVTVVVTNAVDETFQARHNKQACRSAFGLPENKPLVAVVGAISKTRGIENVFTAFRELRHKLPDACLVLAGPIEGMRLPDDEGISYLGAIPYRRVPQLLSAVDVAIIPNIASTFGEYCFPQKFYEALATHTPIVAASVGALRAVLENYPACTYQPDDHSDLASKLATQLSSPFLPSLPIPQWRDIASRLEDVLDNVVRG
jgi:teichuronic acid biosynthesis glycosyltransferase TuaC